MLKRLPLMVLLMAGMLMFNSTAWAGNKNSIFSEDMMRASDLVQAYLKIESPTSQDLAQLKAEPSVRQHGREAVSMLMVGAEAIMNMKDGRLSAKFDPDYNLKLFNLYRDFLPPLTADSQKDHASLQTIGLVFMVRTSEAAQDPVSGQKYYDLLRLLPDLPEPVVPGIGTPRVRGAVSLVRLYCRAGDAVSAARVYEQAVELSGDQVLHYKWEAAAALALAFAEAWQLTEACKYYADLEQMPGNSRSLAEKFQAAMALADQYREAGDAVSAEKLADEIEVMSEQLRIKEAKDKADREAFKVRYEEYLASRPGSAD